MAQDELHYLMAAMLCGGAPAPPILYLGLTVDRDFKDLTLSSVAKRELNASGYRRAELPNGAWTLTRFPPAASANVSIKNIGLDAWPTVRGAFLATTRDSSGLLVAFTPFAEGRIAFPGDSIMFPIIVDF